MYLQINLLWWQIIGFLLLDIRIVMFHGWGKMFLCEKPDFFNVAMHFPLSVNLNKRNIGLKLDFRVMLMKMTKNTNGF